MTTTELAWAAGFLEGEGFFGKASGGVTGFRISCRQNQKEPLEKLQRLFGGWLCAVSTKSNALAKTPVIHDWTVSGDRARGIAFTLFTFLSRQRREQIKAALSGPNEWRPAHTRRRN